MTYGIYITITYLHALEPKKKFAFKITPDFQTFSGRDYFEWKLMKKRRNCSLKT